MQTNQGEEEETSHQHQIHTHGEVRALHVQTRHIVIDVVDVRVEEGGGEKDQGRQRHDAIHRTPDAKGAAQESCASATAGRRSVAQGGVFF